MKSRQPDSYNDLQHIFIDANGNMDKMYGAVDRLEHYHSETHLETAAAMCLEMAAMPDLDIMEKIELTERAQTNWENTLAINRVSSDVLGRHSQVAAMQLACLPLWKRLILTEKNAPLTEIEAAYNRLLQIGKLSMVALEANYDKGRRAVDLDPSHLRGGVAEISVLLLLHRFALKQMQANSWVALPSLYSQNRGHASKGAYLRDGWDISVYTQTRSDLPVKRAYKLQVKSRRHLRPHKEYEEDVTVVAVTDDLVLKQGVRVTNNTILHECVSENEAETRKQRKDTSRRLNLRTERLLDILG